MATETGGIVLKSTPLPVHTSSGNYEGMQTYATCHRCITRHPTGAHHCPLSSQKIRRAFSRGLQLQRRWKQEDQSSRTVGCIKANSSTSDGDSKQSS